MKYTEREELYFTYLNDLRDSGVTNMFGASPYLEAEFGLEKKEARDALVKWMKSFEEDTTEEEDTEEVVEDTEEESTEEEYNVDNSDEVTRFEFSPDNLTPSVYETLAYHEKDREYYRVERYTDKRVYFKSESKKFAPKTSIKFYLVEGLT